MRASIPTSVVDNEYTTFPEGAYDGNIVSAKRVDVKGDGSWIVMKVGVGSIEPREGTNDPGRDRFQGDITLVTDDVDLLTVEDFGDADLPFAIRRSAGLLAGLGEALGVATRENGVVDIDLAAVTAALTDGAFANERVGFEVSHYQAGGKDRDQFKRFGAAL